MNLWYSNQPLIWRKCCRLFTISFISYNKQIIHCFTFHMRHEFLLMSRMKISHVYASSLMLEKISIKISSGAKYFINLHYIYIPYSSIDNNNVSETSVIIFLINWIKNVKQLMQRKLLRRIFFFNGLISKLIRVWFPLNPCKRKLLLHFAAFMMSEKMIAFFFSSFILKDKYHLPCRRMRKRNITMILCY